MTPTLKRHLQAIQSGEVTGTNIIGIRKALNTVARQAEGWGAGTTSPKVSFEDADRILAALHKYQPKVAGEWHEGGLKVLRNPRYAFRFNTHCQYVIDNLSHFQLVDYMAIGRGYHHVPVFRAVAEDGASFTYDNTPWQSGGDGPKVHGYA